MSSTPIDRVMQYQRLKNLADASEGVDPYTDPDMVGSPGMSAAPNILQTRASGADPSVDYQRIMDLVKQFDDTSDHSASDKLNALLSNYPTEKSPGITRTLVAIGAGLGRGGIKAGQDILDEPHEKDLVDWKNQIQPTYEAASLERQSNANNRQVLGTMLSSQNAYDRILAQDRQNQANIASREKIAAENQAIEKAKLEGTEFTASGGHLVAHKRDGTTYDTGIDMTNRTPIEVANITAASREKVANIGAATAAAQGTPFNAATPEGGQTPIYVKRGGSSVPITGPDNKPVGPITKPGTPGQGGADNTTSQTRSMMEGAKFMLPHITELRQQAADLERRGLFGPVMSRIRDLAGKVGTTGSPEEIEKSFQDFSNNVMNDPLINSSNDAAVGRFIVSLGLMASGTGRVHGGARGGGSINMVNYMKSLLSADSTLEMFNGRLDALDSYMKRYALGPNGQATTSQPKDNLDKILDDIFKQGGGK